MTQEITGIDILIIEDSTVQQDEAMRVFPECILVETLKDAQQILQTTRPLTVLSDLYFPSGMEFAQEKPYKDSILQTLEEYISTSFKYGGSNSTLVGHAFEHVCKSIGIEREQFLKILKSGSPFNIPAHQATLEQGIKNVQLEGQYKKMFASMNAGTYQIPFGIFVYEECKEKKIPCITVTSAYHHGPEFEPFSRRLGPYVDRLVDGKKPWKDAYDQIKTRENRG